MDAHHKNGPKEKQGRKIRGRGLKDGKAESGSPAESGNRKETSGPAVDRGHPSRREPLVNLGCQLVAAVCRAVRVIIMKTSTKMATVSQMPRTIMNGPKPFPVSPNASEADAPHLPCA
jgi:hypothetical protein